jgi:hypothetical protein
LINQNKFKMANTTGKKFGGRSKGTPNRTTAEMREMFKDLINDNFDKIRTDLADLEPKERIRILLEMTKFVLPTLRATEIKETPKANDVAQMLANFTDEELRIIDEIQQKATKRQLFKPIVIDLGNGVNPDEVAS